MYISFFNHPDQITEAQWQTDYHRLPKWRQEKVIFYRFLLDRVLCTKAYLLLEEGLRKRYGVKGSVSFDYMAHEKPILKEYPDIHFNLSHCKKGVLCVIDEHTVGCDIEQIEEALDMAVMKHCFNDAEIIQILASSNPCIEFTKFWTMKEAILKLTGEGINDALPSLITPELMVKLEMKTVVVENQDYVYSICQYKSKGSCDSTL